MLSASQLGKRVAQANLGGTLPKTLLQSGCSTPIGPTKSFSCIIFVNLFPSFIVDTGNKVSFILDSAHDDDTQSLQLRN